MPTKGRMEDPFTPGGSQSSLQEEANPNLYQCAGPDDSFFRKRGCALDVRARANVQGAKPRREHMATPAVSIPHKKDKLFERQRVSAVGTVRWVLTGDARCMLTQGVHKCVI